MVKKRTKEILEILHRHYPVDIDCYLDYNEPWELIVATILSAQCTDDRVNRTTKELFKKYDSPEKLADADLKDLEKAVYATGFYRNKAKNIKACMRMLVDEYQGELPVEIDRLTAMPGVGRKTANVVRGAIFKEPSVVVDTHVKRIAGRLGLTKNTDPVKIEFDLMKELPKEEWIAINIMLIAFGREKCRAQRPLCDDCILEKYCGEKKNEKK